MKKLTCGISSIPVIVYFMGNENNKIIGWADADCFVVINIVKNKGCISYAYNFERLNYDTRHKVFQSDHEYSKEYCRKHLN